MENLPCCTLGAMRLVGPSEAPRKDAVDVCETQEQSKLPRELPPEEEVSCVSEQPAAESPREVALPKQERPRQQRSRRSKKRCKAKRKAKSPSHKNGEGAGTQQKAEGNGSQGHERSPRRQGQIRGNFNRGGRSWQLTKWACQLANLVANENEALKLVHQGNVHQEGRQSIHTPPLPRVVAPLATWTALKLLDEKQANQMGKIGQPGNATGSWDKKRGSLPRRNSVKNQ
ncbi:hypothetical protein GH714_030939 [Hevea brasiliensis]|uniref:Uncharacterized protein n=1 Tax=Hevea brasiliensis TaxID=3981 RepID=A0A6A6LFE9_HEVBR|nr:hypothetical protein GH714_030939 [Hevea brasiliensis]